MSFAVPVISDFLVGAFFTYSNDRPLFMSGLASTF